MGTFNCLSSIFSSDSTERPVQQLDPHYCSTSDAKEKL